MWPGPLYVLGISNGCTTACYPSGLDFYLNIICQAVQEETCSQQKTPSIWNYTAIYMSSVIALHPLCILWQPLIISTFCLSPPLLSKSTWILWVFNHNASFDIGDSADKDGLHYTVGADMISELLTEKWKEAVIWPALRCWVIRYVMDIIAAYLNEFFS